MKLSQKDAEILAAGYESAFWRVFCKHFIEDRELEINRDTPFVPNWDGVQIARGRITEIRQIKAQMENIKVKQDKKAR